MSEESSIMQPNRHRHTSPRLLLIYPATHKLGWVKYFQLPSLSLQQVADPVWEEEFKDHPLNTKKKGNEK